VLAEGKQIECISGLSRDMQVDQAPKEESKMAHLITQLRTPEDANKPIREGLIISGRHVWARKMKRS